MTYYVLTFHKVHSNGLMGPMVGNPMVFDTWDGAHEWAMYQYEHDYDVDYRIHETVLLMQPKVVEIAC